MSRANRRARLLVPPEVSSEPLRRAGSGVDASARAELAVETARSGHAAADWLLASLLDTLEADGRVIAPSPGLRAWCRVVEAAIERAPGSRGHA